MPIEIWISSHIDHEKRLQFLNKSLPNLYKQYNNIKIILSISFDESITGLYSDIETIVTHVDNLYIRDGQYRQFEHIYYIFTERYLYINNNVTKIIFIDDDDILLSTIFQYNHPCGLGVNLRNINQELYQELTLMNYDEILQTFDPLKLPYILHTPIYNKDSSYKISIDFSGSWCSPDILQRFLEQEIDTIQRRIKSNTISVIPHTLDGTELHNYISPLLDVSFKNFLYDNYQCEIPDNITILSRNWITKKQWRHDLNKYLEIITILSCQ